MAAGERDPERELALEPLADRDLDRDFDRELDRDLEFDRDRFSPAPKKIKYGQNLKNS